MSARHQPSSIVTQFWMPPQYHFSSSRSVISNKNLNTIQNAFHVRLSHLLTTSFKIIIKLIFFRFTNEDRHTWEGKMFRLHTSQVFVAFHIKLLCWFFCVLTYTRGKYFQSLCSLFRLTLINRKLLLMIQRKVSLWDGREFINCLSNGENSSPQSSRLSRYFKPSVDESNFNIYLL